jgi:hypothetical protein
MYRVCHTADCLQHEYDVVVIGAIPVVTTAAQVTANAGLLVLLL